MHLLIFILWLLVTLSSSSQPHLKEKGHWQVNASQLMNGTAYKRVINMEFVKGNFQRRKRPHAHRSSPKGYNTSKQQVKVNTLFNHSWTFRVYSSDDAKELETIFLVTGCVEDTYVYMQGEGEIHFIIEVEFEFDLN